MQLIHETDVGTALVRCIVGAGQPGAYNIAGDGVVTGADFVHELGLTPVPIPGVVARTVARGLTALPEARCSADHRLGGGGCATVDRRHHQGT